MASFVLAFQTILPLFLVILAGVVMIKLKGATPDWADVLNKYALKIGFPALIFSAMLKMNFSLSENAGLLLSNSIYLIVCMLLAFPVGAILKLKTTTRQSLVLLFGFGNITYLGIPVLVSSFGAKAMDQAVILSSIYLFWMFSLALILIEVAGGGKLHFRTMLVKLVTNPLMIAVFLGTAGSLLKITLPAVVMKSLEIISNSVTAVVLLSLGIFMGSQRLGRLKEWYPVLVMSLIITVLLPALFFLAVRHLPMDALSLKCSVLDAAMPSGLTAYALSHQYRLNTQLAGRLVVLSTLMAILILPAWIAWLS
ncbi:MAG: AEC family transporter [Marinilabiliales bacterium]|nr:AEC family transporter [Marinilabiliales bacterium]